MFIPLVLIGLGVAGPRLAQMLTYPNHLFKCHARWASESAKDGYVQACLSSRLSVSKDLDIWCSNFN